ncbi:MAG: DUF350 domain-containing protein [Mycobacteriales bacterium]|nr:DUF350 domain-containing protein [Mycobacteriales bacterium]
MTLATALATGIADDLLSGALASLAYAGVGAAVLAVGYAALDALTPGRLRHLVYEHRNANAAVVVIANLLALATIVTTAIATSDDELGRGLADAAVYGGLGIVLLALCFRLVDALTPGDLGALVTDERPHPAAWVTAVAQLALGAVLAAAIS